MQWKYISLYLVGMSMGQKKEIDDSGIDEVFEYAYFRKNLPAKPTERLNEFDIGDTAGETTNLVDRDESLGEATNPSVWLFESA